MKILLLSDAPMSSNAGGISQTLYNLFSFSDTKDILCVTSEKVYKSFPQNEYFADRYITYRFEVMDLPESRYTKYFSAYLNWFNYSYNTRWGNFEHIRKQIKDFNPDVVVSCSNGPVGIFMHDKLLTGLNIKKVYPYFMDDWMSQLKLKWVGGEIQQLIKKILSDNTSWLMISKNLSEILQERYDVKPDRVLEIHNPVDLIGALKVTPVQKKQKYRLAYAGALWPMHYDAFYTVAKSVRMLQSKRAIDIVLYTPAQFWDWRKAELEPLGVIYGGHVPYKDIHRKLGESDALILVSSFSKEWYSHSRGSLQTKITDYLKARRLIINCGPQYSANNSFLKKHNCGICIETNDEMEVAGKLNEIFDNIQDYQVLINNGWKLLENEFTFSKVHKRLQYFLAASEPHEVS